jgi:hypothetical protein
MEARPIPPPDEGTAVIFTAAPEPAPQPEPAPEPAPTVAEAEFDPTDFLFGPEPEPDPAADLLDPAPPRPLPRALMLPQPEFVAIPTEEQPPAPSEPATEAVLVAPPHDPLRALNAMSEEEKLALFT